MEENAEPSSPAIEDRRVFPKLRKPLPVLPYCSPQFSKIYAPGELRLRVISLCVASILFYAVSLPLEVYTLGNVWDMTQAKGKAFGWQFVAGSGWKIGCVPILVWLIVAAWVLTTQLSEKPWVDSPSAIKVSMMLLCVVATLSPIAGGFLASITQNRIEYGPGVFAWLISLWIMYFATVVVGKDLARRRRSY